MTPPIAAKASLRQVIEQVILLGLDDVSLTGVPRHLYLGRPADLWKPDAIIVDKVGLRKLFPGQVCSWPSAASLRTASTFPTCAVSRRNVSQFVGLLQSNGSLHFADDLCSDRRRE